MSLNESIVEDGAPESFGGSWAMRSGTGGISRHQTEILK
jgi:hypothetical protein